MLHDLVVEKAFLNKSQKHKLKHTTYIYIPFNSYIPINHIQLKKHKLKPKQTKNVKRAPAKEGLG